MIYETLNDHLLLAGISKKEACILFGRSKRTLESWNDNPPDWVLRIIRLMRKQPPFPDCWDGWYFDRHWLVDDAGNSYSQKDINHLFWQRQFFRNTVGDEHNILVLKEELEHRIKQNKAKICITLEKDGETADSWEIAL